MSVFDIFETLQHFRKLIFNTSALVLRLFFPPVEEQHVLNLLPQIDRTQQLSWKGQRFSLFIVVDAEV